MAIDRGLRLIAYLKFLKALLLLVSGIGLLKLLHKDVADVIAQWINALHVDPDNRHIHNLLLRASVLNEHRLKELSLGSFFYAGLLLTESFGLLLEKPWAKYFTLILTASFIPIEIWELQRHPNAIKTAVIIVNVIIVLYLAARIRNPGSRSTKM